ncbi:hypothetical protein M405DRAFT_491239 [Rhizopogon salebrosus TDB-379]|nr:hypothetical protein M405DRAFT_491239 [Rhizopogon salebrosus TDB-379]
MLDAGLGFHLATSAFVLASLGWRRKYWDNRSHFPLPPGPPPAFQIVRSIFSLNDLPPWFMLFLGVVYARMLNKRAVALNSEEIAKDLFEERSSIYSDKPQRWFTKPLLRTSMPSGNRQCIFSSCRWRYDTKGYCDNRSLPFSLTATRLVPNAKYKRASIKCIQPEAGRDAWEILFQIVKENMYNGHVPPCMVMTG